MDWGSVAYARAGDTHIAYRTVVGDPASDRVVVMINGYFYPMEILPEDPVANRLIEGLAALGTLVMFDRRGIGLSDQIVDWDTPLVDQWVDDVAAVVDAVGCDSVSVFSWHGFGTGRGFATLHPETIDRLILYNALSPPRDQDFEWIEEVSRDLEQLIAGEGDGSAANPNRESDPAFREWQDRAGRLGASPSQAARIHEAEMRPANPGDPAGPANLSGVVAPTLVITRRAPTTKIPAEYLARPATELPNATLAALPDGDYFPIGAGVDAILAEISLFLTGEVRLPRPEREVRVVMLTDLVDSTQRAATDGDARWRRLLDRHDTIARQATARSGGTIVKSTGDGVLALFPSVSASLAAARDMQRSLDDDALAIRTGVHVGEVDDRGGDVSGMAINIAARVMAEAESGQILITETAKLIGRVDGASPAGVRSLKGSDDDWALYEA
jgi:class 3 adenylate cyclase